MPNLAKNQTSYPQLRRADAAEMQSDQDKDCGHGVDKLFLLLESTSHFSTPLLSPAGLPLTPSPMSAVAIRSLVQHSFDLPTKEVRWNFKQPIDDHSNEYIKPCHGPMMADSLGCERR